MRYWLMKSEPGSYSINDLEADGSTHWDGVRNYQARNFMQAMEVGDRVLFYHSSTKPLGVVGLAEVVTESYPDHTAWDPDSHYFDEASTPDAPRWFMVDIAFVEKFPRMVTLDEIRDHPDLAAMPLVNRSRLSVQPVTAGQFDLIGDLAAGPDPGT
ncbi:MAG: EVE domain-containing protein [Acidimicrobiia bacterium]